MSFEERKRAGRAISGTPRLRPQDDPRYRDFIAALRLRNSSIGFSRSVHPLQATAAAWNLTEPTKRFPKGKLDIDLEIPVDFVDTIQKFEEMMKHLTRQKEIALDLEMSLYDGYWTKYACLLQISTWTRDYLVCPFRLQKEIPKLATITNNPDIVKLIFDAGNDLKAFQFQWDLFFVGMLDIQVVYMQFFPRICAGARPSYANVVEHFIPGTRIDKTAQLCDWRVRPLKPKMMEYARMDTHALIRTWAEIKRNLMNAELQNTWNLIVQRCNDMVQKVMHISPYPTSAQIVQKYSSNLNAGRQALFENICYWRTAFSQRLDVKPQHLMTDDQIYDCCVLLPTVVISIEEEGHEQVGLDMVLTVTDRTKRYAESLLQLIRDYLESSRKREHYAPTTQTASPKRFKNSQMDTDGKRGVHVGLPSHQDWPEANTIPVEGRESQVQLDPSVQRVTFVDSAPQVTFIDTFSEEERSTLASPPHSETLSEMLTRCEEDYGSGFVLEVQEVEDEDQKEDDGAGQKQKNTSDGRSAYCTLCYEDGHHRAACKFKGAQLTEEDRSGITANKAAYYVKYPQEKTDRNRRKHKRYRAQRSKKHAENHAK